MKSLYIKNYVSVKYDKAELYLEHELVLSETPYCGVEIVYYISEEVHSCL